MCDAACIVALSLDAKAAASASAFASRESALLQASASIVVVVFAAALAQGKYTTKLDLDTTKWIESRKLMYEAAAESMLSTAQSMLDDLR